ncbi:MvaI/BcnI family restriction endonuclease [Neomesorhizobium albiziae]
MSPNGYAEPDFVGWEVKQYGVNNFTAYRAESPVTLMTPEPTGGFQ